MVQAAAATDIVQLIGMPEGLFPLTQATIYLARAPKSNAVLRAYSAAQADAVETSREPVPLHLRNAPTRLMKELGYGKLYRYAHDEPEAYAAGDATRLTAPDTSPAHHAGTPPAR